MPFQPLTFVPRTVAFKQASLSYKRNDTKNGRSKKPILVLAVPGVLIPSFKPPKDALYEIQIGTGEDAGKARVLRAEKGVVCRPFKNTFVFRFGFIPLLGMDAAEREDIEVRDIDKGAFEITLPAWFKSDTPAVEPVPHIPLKRKAG